MNSFTRALLEYRAGTGALIDVARAADQDLALNRVDMATLHATIADLHATSPFTPDELRALRRYVDDPTFRQTVVNSATQVRTSSAGQNAGRAISVGMTLRDRYYLSESIGRGGMGQVFKAADKRALEAASPDPYVALKVMTVEGEGYDKAFQLMQREAARVRALTHGNIIRVFDFDRDREVCFITMELLQGCPVSDRLENGPPLGKDELSRILTSTVSALSYAHERPTPVVHSDLKPSNLFLEQNGGIKLIDWGIARLAQPAGTPLSQLTIVQGGGGLTLAYASPEMILGKPPDPRDDVYALGCVTYELIAGQHPFGRRDALKAQSDGLKPNRPSGASRSQWNAIRKAMEFDREKRTPSARAFLEDFNSKPTSRLGVMAVAALAALVAVGVGLWQYLRPEDAPPPNAGCELCPDVVQVAAGSQVIGAAVGQSAYDFDSPSHVVRIGAPFALATTEVTVADFRAFVGDAGGDFAGCRTPESGWEIDRSRSWSSPGFPQNDDSPVTCVSWDDAREYAAWLSTQTGQSFRLPSEAEWEFALRSTTPLSDPSSSGEALCNHANVSDAALSRVYADVRRALCDDGYAHTSPVRAIGAEHRLIGLLGNVFEWTADCWNPSYDGAPADGSARLDGDCTSRVLRGGSWFTAPENATVTFRNRFPVDYRASTFGIRVLKEEPQ